MDLRLEVKVRTPARTAALDCRLTAAPEAPVGAVVDALVVHAIERGLLERAPGTVTFAVEGSEPLEREVPIAGAGLHTGAAVVLCVGGVVEPRASRSGPAVLFEVSAPGTDPGATRLVGPGTVTIGGTSRDDVAILGVGLPSGAAIAHLGDDGSIDVRSGAVPVADVGNGTGGASARVGGADVRITFLDLGRDEVGADGAIAYNRTPYRSVAVEERHIGPVPAPPAAGPGSRLPLASLLVPVVSGIGFAVLLGRPEFLALALLAPAAMAVTAAVQRRRGRRTNRQARADFDAAVSDALVAVADAVDAETVERHRALPAIDVLEAAATARRGHLWDRTATAPDRLTVRLGTADDASRVGASVERGGDDELRAAAQRRLDDAGAVVAEVPVPLSLAEHAAVAVVGPSEPAAGVVRSIVAQLVVRHAPQDLVVTAIVPTTSLAEHAWMRWLPHTRASASPILGDHLAVWPDEAAALLGGLVEVASDRAAAGPAQERPVLLLVLHQDAAVDPAVVSRLAELCASADVRLLWVGDDASRVPRQCSATITVSLERTVLDTTDPAVAPLRFDPEQLDRTGAERIARALAPVRDASSVARAGSLPDRTGLLDPLGGAVDADAVAARWATSAVSSLAAPIGMGPQGAFSVDLVEQGPHLLIAGTSGSGKSELLTSLVAGLALAYPPERVTFLFIDFKGGAAAAPFADLPHNVGVVTNLDAVLSQRALVSLRAELDRRMHLLADRAKDLDELARVDPESCPPRLVLVVDEFATLVKEIPDFVAGIVDIAQRGRSLGIHLVLATQRPAGAVNENILANTNLRIALRVVDAADSQSVIGAPDAAGIPVVRRGRALARIGPGELVPFQGAWAGAPARSVAAAVTVVPFGFGGEGDEASVADDGSTQLAVALAAIDAAHRRRGVPAPAAPWQPPLATVVARSALPPAPPGSIPGRHLRIGLRDRPDRQRVEPAIVDLEADGGLVVFGTGGSGRSTVLRTIAAEVAETASPDEAVLVAFDFASRGMLAVDALPHRRIVATADDLEGVCRTLEWLADEAARRRHLLGARRADSWTTLQASEPGAPPRIIVLVDGYGALRAELEAPASFEWFQSLNRTIVDGRQVGIHTVMTADRRSEVPASVLGAISARLVLRMAEPEEQATLGVPLALARGADLCAGRGFIDGDGLVQVAVVGDDPTARAQGGAIEALGERLRARGVPALDADGPLPAVVARPAVDAGPLDLAIGVGDGGEPAMVDLGGGHLAVVGHPGSGRSTALAAVVDALADDGSGVQVVGVGSGRSPLVGHGGFTATGFGPDAWRELLQRLADDLDPDRSRVSTVVVVDAAEDLDDPALAATLERLARHRGVRLAVAADPATLSRAFSGWLQVVRAGRRILHLCPDSPADVEQSSGLRLRLRPGAHFPPGRGVLIVDRRHSIVQVGVGERE